MRRDVGALEGFKTPRHSERKKKWPKNVISIVARVVVVVTAAVWRCRQTGSPHARWRCLLAWLGQVLHVQDNPLARAVEAANKSLKEQVEALKADNKRLVHQVRPVVLFCLFVPGSN